MTGRPVMAHWRHSGGLSECRLPTLCRHSNRPNIGFCQEWDKRPTVAGTMNGRSVSRGLRPHWVIMQ